MEYTNNTEIEIETREQYHARCEERKRLAAERARRQRRLHALIVGGCALIFVGIIGAVVGIRSTVASAHSAGEDRTAVVADLPDVPNEADTVIPDEAVPTEESLTAEVNEFELSEGPAESTDTTQVTDNADDTQPADNPLPDSDGTQPAGDGAQVADTSDTTGASQASGNTNPAAGSNAPYEPLDPVTGESLMVIPEEVISEHAVLISLADNTVLADLGMNDRISPASMTKVLTLLTAVENLPVSL